jgi:type IV secretory pathway TraG/TraD family ATPase VirD4
MGYLEDFVWRSMFKAASLPIKGAVHAVRAGAHAHASRSARSSLRLSRSARSLGVLAPGDPVPPPGVDLLDYRGVATWNHVQRYVSRQPSLGRFLDCRNGPGPQVGIPAQLLFRHAAVIGPAGSGKTRSIIIPWIVSLLRQGCSLVTVDIKGDLLQEIHSHCQATGGPTGAALWIWDYSGGPSHRWNWLSHANDQRSVEAATISILGRPKLNDPQPFFYQRDVRYLRALIRLACREHGPNAQPCHLSELLTDQVLLDQALSRAAAHSPGIADLNELTLMSPDDYSRAVSGLLNALSIFRMPNVQAVSVASDIDLARICDRPSLLVCVAPLADGILGETLSGILMSQVIMQVLGRFGNMNRPLFLIIDEAPRLKDRIDFEQVLAVARGASVGVCLAAQDITQFGDETARTSVFTNCHTFITMPGVSPETASYFSKRLGERHVEQGQIGRGPGPYMMPSYNLSRSSAMVPVLGQREIMHPPFGPYTGIAHVPAIAREPILIDLTGP